jgi:SulP family sulfate permease
VLVDLITAVAVGFVMASVLFVARTADAQVKGARFLFGADQIDDLSSAEEALFEACNKRLVLFHMEGPLSFGSARDIARLMQSDIDKDVLAIDLRAVPFIDSSASAALDEVVERLTEEGDVVVLFGVRDAVRSMLEQTGVLSRLGHQHIFGNRIEALTFAKAYITRRHGDSPDKLSEPEN